MKHNWEYTQGEKTSVKIHNAPGGNSQISFGWSEDQQQNQYQKSYQNKGQTYQTSYQTSSYDGYYGNAPSQGMVSAGAPTRQKEQYSTGRAAVPQYYDQQDRYRQEEMYKQNDEKTSVKVHNPPGGRSNFSYGFDEEPAQKQPYFKQKDMNQKSYGQDRWDQGYQKNSYQPTQEQNSYSGRKKNQAHYQDNNIFGGYQQQEPSPPRQAFQYRAPMNPNSEPTFGQRIEAGNNCGPTTEKSSVKLHAPPGGKSSIQFF